MSQPDNTDRIKRRRAAIAKRRERLVRLEQFISTEKTKLYQEDRELAAAEQIMERLAQTSDSDLMDDLSELIEDADQEMRAHAKSAAPEADSSIPRVGTSRPAGIPTTPEMFDVLLGEAERAGLDGLLGRDLVVGIRHRWWPGAGWNSILPTAFALVQKRRLNRKGRLFVRVRQPAQGAAQADLRH